MNVRYDTAKETGTFSRISPDILHRFSQSVHHMKALFVQMMDVYPIFKFVKGSCHDNQIMLQKNVINASRYHLHSLH